MAIRTAFLALLLGLALHLGVAAAVRSAIPWPLDAAWRAKVHAFRAEKDSFEGVVIGSSRVLRGVRPDILDAGLSTPSHPVRTFNLGVAGMRGWEARELQSQILAMNPERLRWIVVEALDFSPRI